MAMHIPEHLERYLHDQVQAGFLRSEDDEVLDALDRHRQARRRPAAPVVADPVLGSMRDDADLLDEIVEHAMKNRREQPWRLSPGE